MPRPRRYTEHLGLQVSVQEERIMKDYVRSRKMTMADYLREAAVKPVLAAYALAGADGQQE